MYLPEGSVSPSPSSSIISISSCFLRRLSSSCADTLAASSPLFLLAPSCSITTLLWTAGDSSAYPIGPESSSSSFSSSALAIDSSPSSGSSSESASFRFALALLVFALLQSKPSLFPAGFLLACLVSLCDSRLIGRVGAAAAATLLVAGLDGPALVSATARCSQVSASLLRRTTPSDIGSPFQPPSMALLLELCRAEHRPPCSPRLRHTPWSSANRGEWL